MSSTTTSERPGSVDVAIVGGGIGGLAAAVALRRAGVDAHVFERARELKEVGGPLIIRPPSARLLEAWGVDAFFRQAVWIEVVDLLDRDGRLIQTSSMDFHGEGACFTTHRADIHEPLKTSLPAECLHLGLGVSSVANTEDGAHAAIEFTDGSRVEARLVVGADGIHSAVRKAIALDEAVYQEAVVCRTITPASVLPEGMPNDRCRMWADGARRVLTIPVRAGTLVAIDAIIDAEITGEADIGGDLRPENQWNAEIPGETLLERFGDFDPELLRLIEQRTTPVRADLVYDRPIIESWSLGRIVLLGDAAHPMAPRQGQGANQALQDAGALADGVAAFGLDDTTRALAQYHEARYATATAYQDASRKTLPQLGGQPAG